MKKLRSKTLPLAAVGLSIVSIVIGCFCLHTEVSGGEKTPTVTPDILPSLLIGQDELPWDAVLVALKSLGDPSLLIYRSLHQGAVVFEQDWNGPSAEDRDSIIIAVVIASSPEEAVVAAQKEIQSIAAVIPEITEDGSASSFSDRAWCGGSRLVFTRRNVIGDIFVYRKEGVDRGLLFALAAKLGRKIDAALAGSPEPAPVMPVASNRLRIDVEGAWKMRDLGCRLWGAESTTVAVYDANGIPRSMPAKQINGVEYVVPLRHLAAILAPESRIHIRDDEAAITIMNKALVFKRGRSEALTDQRTVQLSREIEFAEGEVLVPLASVVQETIGQGITWEQRGNIKIGRVK